MPGAPTDQDSPARPARRPRAGDLARIGLALALLAWVFSTLPFADRLRFSDPRGVTHVVAGEIQGDWRLAQVRFLASKPDEVDPVWPAELRAAWSHGEPAAVDGDAYAWEPGLLRALRSVQDGWLLVGLALLGVSVLAGVTRWGRLLRLAGCRTGWLNALRLTFLGLFFNLVLPGTTGGDVVKAMLAARDNPGARAQAVVSVAADRVIGLFVLLAIGAVMIPIAGPAFAKLQPAVLLALGGGVVGALLYLNAFLRRLLRLDALLARLPYGDTLASMDRVVQVYARHPLEMGIAALYSLGGQVAAILGVWALGLGFGLGVGQVRPSEWFAMVPVANILSSIPIAPGGWGLGELVYRFLFGLIGAPIALGVAVSVAYRLCLLALSLVGGVYLLTPGARGEVDRMRASAAQPDHPSPG